MDHQYNYNCVMRSISYDEIRSSWGIDIRRVNRIRFCLGDGGCHADAQGLSILAVVNTTPVLGAVDRLNNIANAARPLAIKAVNLLSYVLDHPVEIADFSNYRITDITKDECSSLISQTISSGRSFASHMAVRMQILESQDPDKARYIWSMLEHYRRGLALSSIVETDDWQTPEAMFCFFKIAELSGSYHSARLRKKAALSVKQLVRDYLRECFSESGLEQAALAGADRDAEKIAVTTLTSSSVITQRRLILYALDQLNLYNARVAHYVGEVVRTRNRLAHADVVQFSPYRSGFHPPYYSFPEIDPSLWDFTQVLARAVIASTIGMEIPVAQLYSVLSYLLPAPSEIDEFLASHRVEDLPEAFFDLQSDRDIIDGIELWHVMESKRGDPVLLPYIQRALNVVSETVCRAWLLAEKLIVLRSSLAMDSTIQELGTLFIAGMSASDADDIQAFLNNYDILLNDCKS